MTEFPTTIAAAAAALRAGRVSAAELTQTMLGRSHAAQDALGAFLHISDETASAAARRADADFAAGLDRGPLQGIPLAVKDIIATADAPTTANSRVLDRSWGNRADATVVRRLREAGAVILGKLALHEFAIGWPDPATGFPVVRNPWDLSRSPGGSSSGTGAAVAAGLIFGGLGTDTGGSIRGPSSYCGISGIKATFGRVSKEGCVPLGYSLDNIGPMARTVCDCALMLQALSGYDPADPCSVNTPVPDMTALLDGSLAGVRIGVIREYFFTADELDPEVKAATLAAIEAMEAAGAIITDARIPHAAEGAAAQRITMLSEAYTYHEPDMQTQPELYGRYTRQIIRQGAFYSAADYVQAQRLRSLVKQECAEAMRDADVLVTPTMVTLPPAFAGYQSDTMLKNPSFSGLCNLTGLPALSVPCGFSSGGLPIGMQIIGKPFAEPMVFRVGDAYQQITDWHHRLPTPVWAEQREGQLV